MNIKNKGIISMVLIFIVTVFLYNSYSFAGIVQDADSFLEAGSSQGSIGDTVAMKTTINEVASLLTGLGIIVAVVIGAVLGIQFITGSIEQQAKVKESLIPYICGCIVIFGALVIWKLVIGVFNNAI